TPPPAVPPVAQGATPPSSPPPEPLTVVPAAVPTVEPEMPAKEPNRPASQWKYLPIPEREPDPHSEYDADLRCNPLNGTAMVMARVRGKKHKHEGTNCDDWFTVNPNFHWNLIAVADGAGSSRFSRIGAEASCTKAVELLTQDLALRPPDQPAGDAGAFS